MIQTMRDTLPKGWTIVKLEEVCEILDGKRRPVNASERANRISGKKSSELYPYYGATGQVGFIDDYLLDGEFILLGEDGAPFLDPFKRKSYLVKGKIWVNNHAHVLKFHFENQYLNHYLNIVTYRNFVTGTTRLKLNQSAMREIPVPLAPLNEQKRILAKLEQLLTDLDKGIEYLETTKQQLKVYRQAVLKWAFEGKLTNEIEFKEEKLGSIAKKVTDGEHVTPRRTSEGVFLLSARNIQNGFLSFEKVDFIPEDEYQRIIKRCNPEFGDVLISCSGSVGRICRVPKDLRFTLVRSVALVKFNKEKYQGKYFEYLLQSPQLQSQIEKGKKATAQANLFIEPIKKLQVITCTYDEQTVVIKEIESRLSVCDKIEETIESSLQQAEALRLSIIKKAFEGKLVPQDPNDEPAEQLLERIRALRHSSAKTTTSVRSQPAATDRKKKGKITDRRKVK